MKNFSMDETNTLYRCTQHCTIHKHVVYHEAFKTICMGIREMEKELGEQIQDDYWQLLFQELKRFRFTLYAAPLPVSFQSRNLLDLLNSNKKNCQYFFPSFLPRLQNLINGVFTLIGATDNPLLEKISELVRPEEISETAILLKDSHSFAIVEGTIRNHSVLQNVALVNRHQLRGAQCCRKLFVVGPHYWFPDHIFRAPRAEEIHYIRYGWIQDTWIKQPIFIQPSYSSQAIHSTIEQMGTGNETYKSANEKSEKLDQEEVPEINWYRISTKIMKHTPDDHTQETIPARLFLLAHDQAVFLDVNENAKALALDLETGEEDDEGEVQQLRRISVAKLQPGMFLLLRTGGGGDYIVPIANNILGDKALDFQERQERWKRLLKDEIESKGLLAVCIDLLDRGGSNNVNEINLRYWISSRNIRPQKDNDFSAILKLVGLQGEEMLYQDAANQIKAAHKSAGFYIRKLLIKQVATTNLYDIHKKGYMEFETPQADGGSLTAFRIEHIAPTISSVSYSRIGRPVPAKDY